MSPHEPGHYDNVPPVDPALVARYRKVEDRAVRCQGTPEGDSAAAILRTLSAKHGPRLRQAVEAAKLVEAQAKANADFMRAAASRAAAQAGATDAQSATSQVAFWTVFVEEMITIAASADPSLPLPSAVAYVEHIDFGPPGLMTTLKKTGARGLAAMADRQIAERVADLRAMQRDVERGKIPPAVRRAFQMAKNPKVLTESQTIDALEEESDLEIAESEDDSGEELIEVSMVVPKAVWAGLVAHPNVLMAKLTSMLEEAEDEGDSDGEDEADEDSGTWDPGKPDENSEDDDE